MAAPQQPPPPPTGPSPGSVPSARPPGAGPQTTGLPPPPSSPAAHAADLERQIRRRSWIAAIAIVIAIAAAGVALYLAIDTRDNSATKKDLKEITSTKEAAASEGLFGRLTLAEVARLAETPQTAITVDPNRG
jgi:hypothetical protein